MQQFLHASDSAFEALKHRALGTCIRFRNQEMPPECDPGNADVGFEINAESGAATLLVQRGVQYGGRSPQVADWFARGSRMFDSFADLIAWLRGPLAESFGATTSAGHGQPEGSAVSKAPSAAEMTDLPKVIEGIRKEEMAVCFDEQDLTARLRKRIRGQDDALSALASTVARHCAREQPRRPAVLFAVGPSGVGKTRSAETLAEELSAINGGKCAYHFLRLDMSEYQESHRVSQLIGSPQGYVGHGEGSQLLDALSANPRSIVLFDEIEKAHPAILKVLMNAMDAGRLSSASKTAGGHQVDCRRAIFIFTSNLDAQTILSELESRDGFGDRALEDEVCRRRLHASGIAPEIVGRIGRFLVYRRLSLETRAEIMVGAIAEVAAEYGITISYVEHDTVVELMKSCRSDGFGMRPGQFLIDEALGNAFAAAAKTGHQNFRVVGPPFRCLPIGPVAPAKQQPSPGRDTMGNPSALIFPQNPSLN